MDETDPFCRKVYLYGQKYKDTISIFVKPTPFVNPDSSQKYKLLLKKIQLQLLEHHQNIGVKVNLNFPPLKEKNGLYYFFYNRLNSFVSFKENLIRANFLSNKMKVAH